MHGNSARTDLCGGHRVTGVPTATLDVLAIIATFFCTLQFTVCERSYSCYWMNRGPSF